MILLYNELHHIPTGFIYDFNSRGVIGVIVYGHEIQINMSVYVKSIFF